MSRIVRTGDPAPRGKESPGGPTRTNRSRVGLVAVCLFVTCAVVVGHDRATTAARDRQRLAAAREGALKCVRRQRVFNARRAASPPAWPPPAGTSASTVSPSSVFVPNEEKLYALDVPGTRLEAVGDQNIRLAELRGWLRGVDPVCKGSDPAWYYLLEPDLAWAEAAGLRPSDILRVGNIAALGDLRLRNSPSQIESRPLVRIEFGGWDESKLGSPAPPDWRFRGFAGCPNVFFAFDPLRPVPNGPTLAPGLYVRVVGSLVSDAPHGTKATAGVWLVRNFGLAFAPEHVIHAAERAWSEGGEENPDNPARWTEIHPPDLIEPLPAPPLEETVRGVTVRRAGEILSRFGKPMGLSMAPPAPRPVWARGIKVRETILDADLDGSFARSVSACRVDSSRDAARIHIDLESAGADQFAAIFRVSWSAEGNSWSVVRPRPRPPSQRAQKRQRIADSDPSPLSILFGP
jgi:hypothetical protein